MSVTTDPIADLLTRIRNGSLIKKDSILVPASRLKANVVKVLRDEGYIQSFKLIRDDESKAWIEISLKYDDEGRSVIRGIRRVSRPGLRRYVAYKDVGKIRNGSGTAILSTSKGILTGQLAKTNKAGGELLCEVW